MRGELGQQRLGLEHIDDVERLRKLMAMERILVPNEQLVQVLSRKLELVRARILVRMMVLAKPMVLEQKHVAVGIVNMIMRMSKFIQ